MISLAAALLLPTTGDTMKRIAVTSLVLVALFGSSEAIAQDRAAQNVQTVEDLRCLAAVSETAGAMEKLVPGSANIALMYYLGRLDGRDPDLDIENALAALYPTMTPKDVGSEDVRCGQALSQRGKVMKEIGEHLMERAMKATPPAKAAPPADHSL